MVASTSIEVTYKSIEGWHVFEADQMPGFYIAHRDPKRAYEAVCPAIEKLIELDTGMVVRVAPEVPLSEFIDNARAALTRAAASQKFNLFKEAA